MLLPELKNDFELFDLFERSPSAWMEDTLGIASLEDYQNRLGEAIVKYDKVAIRAAHSLGKTWYMARVALWFLSNYDNAIVITTAPTHRQVQKLLWGELRDAYKTSKTPLGGRLLDMELKYSDKHYAVGFSPQSKASSSNEQQGSSFQGFHSDHVLIIFDEATGVSPDIWVMAQGLLTSGKIVKFVAIANPTTKSCSFFDCFSSPEWHKIQINCFDSPNLIANGLVDKESLQDEMDRLSVLSEDERISQIQQYEKPVPYLLTAQFVVPYVMRLGMDHPLVLSKVFGEFPKTEDNVLVQYEDIEAAVKREVELGEKRYIGVDVARFGADKTVISELVGYKQTLAKVMVKRDIAEVTGQVVNLILESALPGVVTIDATGLGAGVYDMLIEHQNNGVFSRDIQIVEAHFGASPANPDQRKDEQEQDKSRYANLKAKMFDLLGHDLKHHIDLMDESIYYEELPSIEYKFDSKGRIVIESKKDYKSRTGRSSPDYSDSLALANYGRHVTISAGGFYKDDSKRVERRDSDERARTPSGIRIREY